MKASRAPGTVWFLRREDLGKYVRAEANETIVLSDYSEDMACVQVFVMSRKDARLFAKRINECLDATVKR